MQINQYFRLALRNIFRHRARSAATLTAIAVGIAGLILAGGFIKDIYIQLGEAIIHSQTGHIQVTRQGYGQGKNRSPEKYLIENPGDLRDQLKSFPAIGLVSTRLTFSGTINNGKRDLGIIGEGIEPDIESDIGTYLHFVEGRRLKNSDSYGIVVGQGVAKSLGLSVGDRVTVLATLAQGAVNTLDFEVIGVFQSFSRDFDARAIRISLDAAQSLMDTDAAHMLVVMLQGTDMTTATTIKLQKLLSPTGFDVTSWNTLSDFYEKTVELYDRQFGVLRLIILIMVLLSVANSVNMTLFERTREFGTVLALGDRTSGVFNLIVAEGLCLGVMGAFLGILLGCVSAFGISLIGIAMPPPPNANLGYTALIRLEFPSVIAAGFIGFLACFLASLLPARKASKLDIGEALRHGV
ncbi:MAG: ABC transporter permease [Betaproteobacteria bacterium HGW-Betaproteobacteria-5]|jgi:putative ABC transport system permease protein|nr:MAG: ABC transporter permease [Betaproteobacteria bacterium HGW-Betaproteobacteria-5]PKO37605.1 MAG: ABC transporter permease [Betaproteobacteria bacterium HGW-Betaproteobacteria-6]